MFKSMFSIVCAASVCIGAAVAKTEKVRAIHAQPYGEIEPYSGEQYPSDFRELAAEGLAQIKSGNLDGGIATLIKASKIPFERPQGVNYELWDEIAQAECRKGDYVAGQSLFKEYRCVVSMNVYETACYLGDTATPIPNSALSPLCFRAACGDAWEPSAFQMGGQSEGDAVESYDRGEGELARVDKLIKSCRASRTTPKPGK